MRLLRLNDLITSYTDARPGTGLVVDLDLSTASGPPASRYRTWQMKRAFLALRQCSFVLTLWSIDPPRRAVFTDVLGWAQGFNRPGSMLFQWPTRPQELSRTSIITSLNEKMGAGEACEMARTAIRSARRISPQAGNMISENSTTGRIRTPPNSASVPWCPNCSSNANIMPSHNVNRRDFLGGLAALAAISSASAAGGDEMPYRMLGSTGQKVSAIGLGGYHLGRQRIEEPDAIKLFHAAIDRGINFSDNSWDYNDGESERRVGKALKGYREKVFVMTKFDGRTKGSALQQLDESLQRLQTDHVDLWQFHENIRLEDPDRFFADGGAVEAMLEAKKAGKIRFMGFTGHKDPSVHLRMLELADKHQFKFDTAQMPLNVMDAHFRSFASQVVPVLVQKQMGVLGMKTFGDKHILASNTATPMECLHYSLSLPTSVVITGIDSMPILDQAFQAAKTVASLSKSDISAILSKTATAAATGKYEPFKTTAQFDSTATHPSWLGYTPQS